MPGIVSASSRLRIGYPLHVLFGCDAVLETRHSLTSSPATAMVRPQEWNSATPHNYRQLSKLPYWEQVVEQQFETNHAVGQQLQKLPTGRFIEIWYEQLCNSPGIVLSQIRDFFGVHHLTCENLEVTVPTLQESAGPQNMEQDKRHIDDYIRLAEDRFKPYQFDSVAASD